MEVATIFVPKMRHPIGMRAMNSAAIRGDRMVLEDLLVHRPGDRAVILGDRLVLEETLTLVPMNSVVVVATLADNRERLFLGTLLVCPVRQPAVMMTPSLRTRAARLEQEPALHVDARGMVALRPRPRFPIAEEGHHQRHQDTKDDRGLGPSSNGSETS